MAVDWSKPIEAVHEDGAVVSVQLRADGKPGERITFPSVGVNNSNTWLENGRNWFGSNWRIRNVQPAAVKPAISDELVERMVAFVREMAGKGRGFDPDTTLYMVASQFDEARAIAAELPQPVDPDLLEARRYLVDHQYCRQETADSGKFDDHEVVGGFLAGLARGRALERGES